MRTPIALPPQWVYVTFDATSNGTHYMLKWVVLDANKREARKIIHDAWREANVANGGNFTLEGYNLWANNYRIDVRTLIAEGHFTQYVDTETESAIAFLDELARYR